ncbi:MAG: carboxypeptidase regulatory-like domain-containing protein, partial [Bacteroidota bacterium]
MNPVSSWAQGGGWPGAGGGGGIPKIGRMYGKIVDENGKGVAYASVQIFGTEMNPDTKQPEQQLMGGQITATNGDFALEKLPIRGTLTVKISLLGYAEYTQEVSFASPKSGGGGVKIGRSSGRSGWGGGGGGGGFDKDLGNLILKPEIMTMDEVVIEGEVSQMTLALDKRVFRVDKNINAVGGTAVDALQNVPSLSVDLDGNVTLRNAAPQIFVDGRPTTLSLDQIPSDAIENVEIITNPSAKYDAGGGQAGIVNIVMKKNRRIGYNGSVRAGVDSRLGSNFGGNINAREGKVNVFMSAFANNRISVGEGETYRENRFGSPLTNVTQLTESQFQGTFASLRGGLDWFVDNRNTLTFSGSYTRGQFTPENTLRTLTDSLFESGIRTSESVRISTQNRGFQNT